MLRRNCALWIGNIIFHVYFDVKKSNRSGLFPGIALRCELQLMELRKLAPVHL